MTSNTPIVSDTSDDESIRYFSPVLTNDEGLPSGEELDNNFLIDLPSSRHKVSYRDIRIKLVKKGFDLALKGKGYSSFAFCPCKRCPCRLVPKQEPDSEKWNIWKYLGREGTGSYHNPHPIFVIPQV